ncbi:KEOPS complex subunit Pcc1 [Nanoarchaeota archaeon]
MKYRLTLVVDEDIDMLYDCLVPEISKRERSELKIEKGKDSLKLIMNAQDSVALRATANSLIKLLLMHEKIKKVKDGN